MSILGIIVGIGLGWFVFDVIANQATPKNTYKHTPNLENLDTSDPYFHNPYN